MAPYLATRCWLEGTLVTQGAPAANSFTRTNWRVVKRRVSAPPSAAMTVMNFLSMTLTLTCAACATGASGNGVGGTPMGDMFAELPAALASLRKAMGILY